MYFSLIYFYIITQFFNFFNFLKKFIKFDLLEQYTRVFAFSKFLKKKIKQFRHKYYFTKLFKLDFIGFYFFSKKVYYSRKKGDLTFIVYKPSILLKQFFFFEKNLINFGKTNKFKNCKINKFYLFIFKKRFLLEFFYFNYYFFKNKSSISLLDLIFLVFSKKHNFFISNKYEYRILNLNKIEDLFILYFNSKIRLIKRNKSINYKINFYNFFNIYKNNLKKILYVYNINYNYLNFKNYFLNFNKKNNSIFSVSVSDQINKIKFNPTDFSKYNDIENIKYLNFFFLRKNRIFNKGRYSRNRQLYRTGVYWCLWLNIVIVYGLYFLFYKFTFNFGFLWWVFFILIYSFIFNKILKYKFYNFFFLLNEFFFFIKWVSLNLLNLLNFLLYFVFKKINFFKSFDLYNFNFIIFLNNYYNFFFIKYLKYFYKKYKIFEEDLLDIIWINFYFRDKFLKNFDLMLNFFKNLYNLIFLNR